MARSKKVKKITTKEIKRTAKKSKSKIISTSEILSQINQLMGKLSQDLQKQATPLQKQSQSLSSKLDKAKSLQEKTIARLTAMETKIAAKGGSSAAKKQLKHLKASADKATKSKTGLEKELSEVQSELKTVKEGSSRLTTLQKLVRQSEQDWKQDAQKKPWGEKPIQKKQVNEEITSSGLGLRANRYSNS